MTTNVVVYGTFCLRCGHFIRTNRTPNLKKKRYEVRAGKDNYMALNKDFGLCRIKAGCQVQSCYVVGSLVQLGWVMRCSDRVKVNDKEKVLVLILIGNPLPNRTQIVPKMQIPSRLNSGDYSFANWRLGFWICCAL